MTSSSSRRKWIAVAFAALVLVEGVAVVSGTHRLPDYEDNPLVRALFDRQEAPPTSEPALDRKLREIVDEHHRRIQILNATLEESYASSGGLVSGRVFEDEAADDGRVGGFGDWTNLGGDHWAGSDAEPLQGNWSYAFGDARGLYPEAATAYFVTPRIDLRHVPVLSDARNQVRYDPMDQQVLAHPVLDLVFLAVRHRFNLAEGTDGARVEVFDAPPGKDRLPRHATALLPVDVSLFGTPDAEPSPEYASVARFQDEEDYNGNVESRGLAFTGSSDETVSVFDLTPFAGREIWIAFTVRTHLQPGGAAYFADETRFGASDFFGWQVDDVLVNAPLRPRHLRIESASATPSMHDPLTGVHAVAPERDVNLTFVAQNAGAWPANATLSLTVYPEGASVPSAEWRTPITLEAAEVREVDVPWRFDAPGGDATAYRVHASLTAVNESATATGGEHERDLGIVATRVERPILQLDAEPFFLNVQGEGSVSANATNLGNVPGAWRIALALKNESGDDHAALFLDSPATRIVPLDPSENRTVSWNVRPTLAGRYVAEARLLPDGGAVAPLATATARLNVEQGPRVVFHDDYRDPPRATHGTLDDVNWSTHPLGVPEWPWSDPAKRLWRSADEQSNALLGSGAGASGDSVLAPKPGGRGFVLDVTYQNGPLDVRLHYVLPPESFPLNNNVDFFTGPTNVLVHGGAPSIADDEQGWRRVVVPLDDALGRLRAPDTADGGWDPSRVRVEFVSRATNVFMKEMRLDYTPIGSLDRATLFAYEGERLAGQFQNRQRQHGTALVEASRWEEVDEATLAALVPSANGPTVRPSPWEPRHVPVWEARPGFRIASPPISLADAPQPILAFEHRYGTVVSFPAQGVQEPPLVEQVAVVELQILGENGQWGPWRRIQPEGGYPTTSSVGDFEGDLLGRGYFAPSDYVLERPNLWRFDRHGGSGGWESTVFDLANQSSLADADLRGAVVRLGFHLTPDVAAPPPDPSRGWWLRPVTLLPAPTLVNDASVEEVDLDVPYDYATLGTPPGIEVPVRVTVRNGGLRSVTSAEVALVVTNVTTGYVTNVTACREVDGEACAVALAPGETKSVTFPWTPTEGGHAHELTASVTTGGRFRDENPFNDNGTLGDHLRLESRTVVAATVRLEAAPLEGGLSERILRPIVANTGNVPLRDVALERTIVAEGSLPVSSTAWTLRGPVLPDGKSRSLLDPALGALDERGASVSFAKDAAWTPPAPGAYAARLRLVAPDGSALSETSAEFSAATTTFRDDFADGRVGGVGDWVTEGEGWHLSRAAGGSGGSRFRFGDAAGDYPAAADASLVSPVVDVSTSKTARLTLLVNHSLEEHYDAGVVEASLDGGDSWTRLEPERTPVLPSGYPGVVAAANPLNVANDPTVAIRALTGESAGASATAAEAGGRIPVTFPLHRMEGLAHVVEVAPLAITGPLEEGLERVAGSGRAFSNASWHAEGFPERTWSAENLTHRTPLPHESTHMRVIPASSGTVRVELPLAPEIATREDLVWDFWDWREGVSATDRDGSRFYQIRACAGPGACPSGAGSLVYQVGFDHRPPEPAFRIDLAYVHTVAVEGEWTLRRVDVGRLVRDGYCGATGSACGTLTVDFRFVDTSGNYDHYSRNGGSRGWAFGPARLATTTDGTVWAAQDPASPADWVGGSREERLPEVPSGFTPAIVDGGARWSWTPEPLADGRLVTPPIDLTGVSGDAALAFRHRSPGEASVRVVEVQVLDPITGSWGPWDVLFARAHPDVSARVVQKYGERSVLPAAEREATGYDRVFIGAPSSFPRAVRDYVMEHPIEGEVPLRPVEFTHSFGSTGNAWRDARFDLDPYAGRVVRLAFHASVSDPGSPSGPVWEISDVSVTGAALEGRPVQFRLRAVTDENGNAGFWDVEEAIVSGRTYGLNLRLTMHADAERTADSVVNVSASVRRVGSARPPSSLALVLDGPGTLVDADGSPTATNVVLLAPRPDGGRAGDTVATANFTVRFPDVPGAYDLRARIEEALPGGGTRVVPADVPGFLSATSRVTVVEPTRELHVRVDTPIEARAGEAAPVRVTVRNNGTDGEDVAWRLAVTHESGSPACAFQGSVRLEPFTEDELERSCVLTHDGRHSVEAAAEASGASASASAVTHVAPRKVFLEEGFEAGRAGWRSRATPQSESTPEAPGGGPPASQSPRYGSSRNSGVDEWRRSNSESRTGEWAWLFGPETDLFEKGRRYGDFVDASLESAPVDLRDVAGNRSFLSIWHRPSFSRGDGGVVEARAVDAETGSPHTRWLRLEPVGGYPGRTESEGQFSPTVGDGPPTCRPCYLNPLGRGTPAFTGIADEWQQAVLDLSQHPALVGAVVQVRLRVGTMEATDENGDLRPLHPQTGQGWFVDDVTVSAVAVELLPKEQVIKQADGLTKPHFVRVANIGVLDAGVTPSILLDRSSADAEDIFRLVDAPERIPGGEARTLRIDARAPAVQSGLSSEQRLAVRVAVAEAPSVAQDATLDLRLTPREHPHVVTRLEIAPGARLETAVPHSVLAVVENRGDVPTSPARLVLKAVFLPTGDTFEVGAAPLPSLAPRALGHVVHLTWTPPNVLGPYVLRAEADPDGVNGNVHPADAVAEVEVQVVPLRRPDLRIVAFQATRLDGSPIDAAAEGDLVQFSALVFNGGTADAVDVTVHLFVGGTLAKIERVPRLPPGASASVLVNQFVGGSATSYAVDATTASVEAATDDNRKEGVLTVVGGSARWESEGGREGLVDASVGRTLKVRLVHDDSDLRTYVLDAEAPPGLRVDLEPRTLVLSARESAEVNVTLSATRGLAAGDYTIPVFARPVEPGLPAVLNVRANVPLVRDVRLAVSVAAGAAGSVEATVRNDGNGEERLVALVTSESGDRIAEIPLVIAPGGLDVLTISVVDPARASVGVHPVRVQIVADETPVIGASVGVPVAASYAIEATPSPELPGHVHVRATGNAPTRVSLDARTASGIPTRIEPSVLTMAPGDEVTAVVMAPRTVRDTPGPQEVIVTATVAETGVAIRLPLTLVESRSPLSIDGATYRPAGGATSSGIHVVVVNDAPRESGSHRLRLYVDGLLVDAEDLDPVPAGSSIETVLPWAPTGDRHAVVVVVEPLASTEAGSAGHAFAILVDREGERGLSGIQPVPAGTGALLVLVLACAALTTSHRRRPR